jgi:glycosyltransferase involved in cell wall biosynthesis
MQNYVLWLMRVFYQHTSPVICPCEAYRKKLIEELHVKPQNIVVLPRGIELRDFDPNLRVRPSAPKKINFLYVGRISKEKDIPFLEQVWSKFAEKYPDAELTFVGGGWYLETLRKNSEGKPSVKCLGVKAGRELAALYANADFFVFPSGSDTFGNVVVESFASGTPALVSDEGGPQDIVGQGSSPGCGWVVRFHQEEAWFAALEHARALYLERPDAYEAMRKACVERSRDFSLDAMTGAQKNFLYSIV